MKKIITEEMISKIFSGNAILFVGAGFSKGAIGYDGELPVSEKLIEIMYKIAGIQNTSDVPLQDVANWFLNKHSDKRQEFVDRLKDAFTVTQPQEYHRIIASLPWKRIYTTNYDDVIEKASKKRIEGLDLTDKVPSGDKANSNFCLHINGRVSNLTVEKLDNEFKLSRSSYVSSSSIFAGNYTWNNAFECDLRMASLIVFVGYSLYDIDIERVLFNVSQLKEKTIFITSASAEDEVRDYKFKDYGTLFRIGAEGFAEYFKNIDEQKYQKDPKAFACFKPYRIQSSLKAHCDIRDQERLEFLYNGIYRDDVLQYITQSKDNQSFMVLREELRQDAIDKILQTQMLIIYGGLGNGKSILLRQLAIHFANEANVYFVEKWDLGTQLQEFELIAQNKQLSYVLIDDYLENKELIKYYSMKRFEHVKIIFTLRTADFQQVLRELEEKNSTPNKLQISSVSVEELFDDDIHTMVLNLNKLSLWTHIKTAQSDQARKRYIQKQCKKELANLLLDIVKSPTIQKKIEDDLQSVIGNKELREILVAICFLQVAGISASYSLLDVILENYCSLNVIRRSSLKHFMEVHTQENIIQPKSSIFSLMILRSCFKPNELIETFLRFLCRIHSELYYQDRVIHNVIRNVISEVYTKLLNFNLIERIFDNDKRHSLDTYYEKIKEEIPLIIKDPQYWLQCAMCQIALGKLDYAERFLQSAYDRAKEITYNYDTEKLDNQKARLYIKQSCRTKDVEESFKLFSQALSLLSKQRFGIHKYKILLECSDFFDKFLEDMSTDNKRLITQKCRNFLKDIDKNLSNKKRKYSDRVVFDNCKKMLQDTIDKIGTIES